MEWAGAAVVLLAFVFAVSGITKALDPVGTREAVTAFGVPPALVPLVARGLPVAEVLTVGALLLAPGAGLWAGLLLLAAFTTAVLRLLARGEHPSCQCFGRLGSSDVSWRTVLRNAVLLAAAATALLRGPADLGVVPALAGAVLGAGLLALEAAGARQRVARDLASLEDSLGDISPVPDLVGSSLSGERVPVADLLDGRPVLLVFLSPGCGTCVRMVPSVARWALVHSDRLRVTAVVSGPPERARTLFAGAPRLTVLLDDDLGVRNGFGVPGSPGAVLLDAQRRVVGTPALGLRGVQRLLDAALDLPPQLQPEQVDGSFVAAPSPSVHGRVESGRTTLTDGLTNAVVELDELGALVWSFLDGRSTLHEIALDLADASGAPVDVVEADVVALAQSLGRAGMLDGVAPELVEVSADAG